MNEEEILNQEENNADETKPQNSSDDPESKTYTEEEVAKIKAELSGQIEEKSKAEIQKALDEQKRLSALTEDEKKAELAKTRQNELETREAALALKESLYEVKESLINKNLPVFAAEYIAGIDKDKRDDMISNFEKEFRNAVKKEVDSKIKGHSLTAERKAEEAPEDIAGKIAEEINSRARAAKKLNPWG